MSNEDMAMPEEHLAVVRTQKPYLINALRQWCEDLGELPHILVDATWPGITGLPPLLVQPHLVLNISARATSSFVCDRDGLSVQMRFNTVLHHLFFPIGSIRAIYAPGAGNVGMSFESFQEQRPEEAENDPPANEEVPRERPSFLSVVK